MSRPTLHRRLLASLLFAALSLWLGTALGQPTEADKAAAEALFQQAKAHYERGELVPACDKLAASQELEPAVGTLLYLGDCYEKLGRTATAWAQFEHAASLASRQQDGERRRIAEVRAAALAPRLTRLNIVVAVDNDMPGLTVKRGDVELPPSSLGIPLPVDPGRHEISATAPGYEPWSTVVSVAASAGSLTVGVPALVALAPPPDAAPPAPPAEVLNPPAEIAQPQPVEEDSAWRTAGIVAAGTGAAGLVVGSVFGLLAKSANDDSLEQCRTETLCNQEGLDLRDEARGHATVSTVGFIAGGVLAAAGVALILAAPAAEGDVAADLRLELTPGLAGLVIRGGW